MAVPHAVNALAGCFLVLPLIKVKVFVNDAENQKVNCTISRIWTIAYTLWNATFIYNNNHLIGATFVLLIAPLLISWKNPKVYFYARSYILSTHYIFKYLVSLELAKQFTLIPYVILPSLAGFFSMMSLAMALLTLSPLYNRLSIWLKKVISPGA